MDSEGAVYEVIAPKIACVTSSDGTAVAAKHKIDGGPSVLFDAVAILVSAEGAKLLAGDAAAKDFVTDAFTHCKFIGTSAEAMPIFEKAGLAEDLDEVVCRSQNRRTPRRSSWPAGRCVTGSENCRLTWTPRLDEACRCFRRSQHDSHLYVACAVDHASIPFDLTLFEEQPNVDGGTPYRPGLNDPTMLSDIASIEIPPIEESLIDWLAKQPTERLLSLDIEPFELDERTFYAQRDRP